MSTKSSVELCPNVFVVHGRDSKPLEAMGEFLERLGLHVITWGEAGQRTKKSAPTLLETMRAGFEQATIAIILFTPDEKVQLREEFANSEAEKHPAYQPRPNVFLEAGVAFFERPEQTIWVCLGEMRLDAVSDLQGIHYLKFDNSPSKRRDLVERIKNALRSRGCDVELDETCIDNLDIAPDFGIKSIDPNSTLVELTVSRTEKIFESGIAYLKQAPHKNVTIYAPSGAWQKIDNKPEWFKTIAGCLAKHYKIRQPRADLSVPYAVEEFVGVYGLPPITRDEEGRLVNPTRFEKALNYMENLLLPFDGLPNAFIYYLPNAQYIPGSGSIIIDDTALFIGFATSNQYTVDFGFLLANERQITSHVRDWFQTNVMRLAGQNKLQYITDVDPTITLKQGMNQVRENLGLSIRKKYPK